MEILKNKLPPRHGTGTKTTKYDLSTLAVGDTAQIPLDDQALVRSWLYQHKLATGKSFKTWKETAFLYVYREEDPPTRIGTICQEPHKLRQKCVVEHCKLETADQARSRVAAAMSSTKFRFCISNGEGICISEDPRCPHNMARNAEREVLGEEHEE